MATPSTELNGCNFLEFAKVQPYRNFRLALNKEQSPTMLFL